MTIPVTTRSGKGSPLTSNEMDTNLTDLSRNAEVSVLGNIEIATVAEANTGTNNTKAVTPEGVLSAINTNAAESATLVQGANGYYLDPNTNFLYEWGFDSFGPGVSTINFHTPFDANPFSISLTLERTPNQQVDANLMVTGTPSSTSFNIFAAGAGTFNVYWTARGIKS